MATRRTTSNKRERERSKQAKAAAKRERRLDKSPDEETDAIAAFDTAELVVREYLKAEVKKADSIVVFVRRTEAIAEARLKESARLYEAK